MKIPKLKIPYPKTLKKILILTLTLTLLLSIAIIVFVKPDNTGSLVFTGAAPQENYIFKKYAYISGEITNPGVYEFKDGMRVNELIDLAGGYTADADIVQISKNLNLSKKLEDEEHIYIPSVNGLNLSTTKDTTTISKVDLNTANLDELEALNGIGPATAQKIIDARPYENLDDFKTKSKIGDAKFNQIKDFVEVL